MPTVANELLITFLDDREPILLKIRGMFEPWLLNGIRTLPVNIDREQAILSLSNFSQRKISTNAITLQ